MTSLHQNDLEDHLLQAALTWEYGNKSLKNMIVMLEVSVLTERPLWGLW